MTTWTVGQPCIVVSRGVLPATVVKVARKYVTVEANGRTLDFDKESGRYRGESHGSGFHLSTVEAYAADQKRAAVYKDVRALHDNWHRLKLTDEQLDELTAVIGRMR